MGNIGQLLDHVLRYVWVAHLASIIALGFVVWAEWNHLQPGDRLGLQPIIWLAVCVAVDAFAFALEQLRHVRETREAATLRRQIDSLQSRTRRIEDAQIGRELTAEMQSRLALAIESHRGIHFQFSWESKSGGFPTEEIEVFWAGIAKVITAAGWQRDSTWQVDIPEAYVTTGLGIRIVRNPVDESGAAEAVAGAIPGSLVVTDAVVPAGKLTLNIPLKPSLVD